MTGFFNTAALAVSNVPMETESDSATIWLLMIGITVVMAWVAFFNHQWVLHTENPTKLARREMQIAIFAPITVPILGALLVVKTVRNINKVAA
jgi:hypothetical protein